MKRNEAGATRRQWMVGLAAVPLFAAAQPLRLRVFEPGGTPAARRYLESLVLYGLDSLPYPLEPRMGPAGTAEYNLPSGNFEISMLMPVRNFGTIYLYADNAGKLYEPAGRDLLLNYEFASSRALLVRRYVDAGLASGVVFRPEVAARLARGEALLKRATATQETAQRAALANDSLTETIWAGEMAAIDRARYRIARQGPRPGFLFGAYTYPIGKTDGPVRLFKELLNAATIPLYRRGTGMPYIRPGVEPVEGHPDYSLADAAVEKLAGLSLKGHPLMWFGGPGLPDFLRGRSWEAVKQSCRDHLLRTVTRYRTRIHAWDVINEAHGTANDFHYTKEQMLELTRAAAEWTRAADPTAFRVVNSNRPWADYAQKGRMGGGEQPWSPVTYYKALADARIPYEAIGVQMYDPRRDMLEIERTLERYFAFGKQVWITELGISASSLPDENGRQPSPDVWHGTEWSERIQADWVEQFYTLCFSKPQIEAVSWWNFTDPALHPNAGLVTADLRPKEAYYRLKKLIQSWRSA